MERFIEAQETDYNLALKELKKGKKVTHWMWYIFPQLKGLGYSDMAVYYGIEDEEEAKLYLNTHPLGQRLITLCNVLLKLRTNNAKMIFGPIDAMKLQSSMTLFYAASEGDRRQQVFKFVLEKFFDGELCQKTLQIMQGGKEEKHA